MPYDIDWETACNDFHPAFALVRGERYEPDAKPLPPKRARLEKRPARLRTAILLIPELLS